MAVTIDGTTGITSPAIDLTTPLAVADGGTARSDNVMSMVRLNTNGATTAGYGSTNTAIRRFVNVVTNTGSDITYADSATLGASFTINTDGVYSISHCDSYNTSGLTSGISVDSAALATGVASIPASTCLAVASGNAGNATINSSWTGFLSAGAVVRPHGYVAANTGTVPAQFTITRVR